MLAELVPPPSHGKVRHDTVDQKVMLLLIQHWRSLHNYSKDIVEREDNYMKLIGNSKLPIGVNVRVNCCLCLSGHVMSW